MSRWHRQANLTNLFPSPGTEGADVIKNNRNKTTLIVIVGIAIFITIISVAAAGKLFSVVINTSSNKLNDVLVVHTQPTVEPLDLTGVSHLDGASAENTLSSTQIEVSSGKIKATVNGESVPINQNGTTQTVIPNPDGTTTHITSTSNTGTSSNSVNINTLVNSTNVTSHTNNFTSSFSHIHQTGTETSR